MEDETIQTPAPQTPDVQPPENPEKVSFSPEQQAEVNRIVAREKSSAAKKAETDTVEREKRSKLEVEERLKLEKADAEKERDEAVAKARAAGFRADLKNEVNDIRLALLAIDPERHIKEDGSVDIKALLKDHPSLAPNKASAPGAGGVQDNPSPDARSSLTAAMKADGINLNG